MKALLTSDRVPGQASGQGILPRPSLAVGSRIVGSRTPPALAAVLQALEVGESTFDRWRAQYGGMKCEEAKGLKQLEDENKRLKTLVADRSLDHQMLRHLSEGNWQYGSHLIPARLRPAFP